MRHHGGRCHTYTVSSLWLLMIFIIVTVLSSSLVMGEDMCGTLPLCTGHGDCIDNDCQCHGRYGLRFCMKDFGSTSSWTAYLIFRYSFIIIVSVTQTIALYRVTRVVIDRWRGYVDQPMHTKHDHRGTCCYVFTDTQICMLICLVIAGTFRLLWIVDPYHIERFVLIIITLTITIVIINPFIRLPLYQTCATLMSIM
jgi:hypothetical protein